ncbi:phytanoyl-CoA dioxygenase family protein [Sphingomonas sp. So64.6b]|uniref:phytanoyl-CoA dioxygenase family protein n=1 Tax=Sphingomonas sp. So64.6b TaxID=2997354 RepID=UPI0015FFC6D9|nr:phytanoyl-CoA dioxygenase family protein [Sphingomonas sp. So64.6b]QNA86593.1 phytanoyl-CoA dioxygenase family protein [Sphingomonas sp. So64.6b]
MATRPHTEPRIDSRGRDFAWQDIPADRTLRRLDHEQAAAFDRDGFVLIRDAFTPDEIAAVIATIDPIEEAYERYVSEQMGGQFRLTSSGTITFAAHLVTKSDVLRSFAAHPAIRDLCRDLAGDRVRLYWDQSVYKKTGKAQEFPWHQDNGYTFIEPQQYLTFWIPLVDVDVDNGCPWIAPGKHRLGTLEHWQTPIGLKCLEEAEDAVAVPAKAGDIILFSSLAPHRTGPNLKQGTVRKAYILQYAPDGAHALAADGSTVAQDDPARQFLIVDE